MSGTNTSFTPRHIGPTASEQIHMLSLLGQTSLTDLTKAIVPSDILDMSDMALPAPVGEADALAHIQSYADQNVAAKSLIGQGYYGTFLPPVIQRNVLENPGWYTAYTPYQPEISQGRLEILFNFQTLCVELTGMDVANASLLDEGTAAAEAMGLAWKAARMKRSTFLVMEDCHPQTLDVLATRAEAHNIQIVTQKWDQPVANPDDVFGVLIQYPGTHGAIATADTLAPFTSIAGALTIFAADPLALTVLKSPAELGADIVVGSLQRFGVPMGLGGPHAAFFATKNKHQRVMPGRLVGQSIDSHGEPAYRLALQTREQHIRREKATSNICTAQALLAIIATLYAMYHGREGLQAIAKQVYNQSHTLHAALVKAGKSVSEAPFFDTISLSAGSESDKILSDLSAAGYRAGLAANGNILLSLDETTRDSDVEKLTEILTGTAISDISEHDMPSELSRADAYLSQEAFHIYQSETEMMRLLRRLADRDLALDRTMIPLGSCTMKLNAAAEMLPITWAGFANLHPFSPKEDHKGFQQLIQDLDDWLSAATGFHKVSLQPNSGAQGEFAGLLAIKRYHESRGDQDRNIVLIPSSAHGTNPASAQMAGMDVVVVACDDAGNVDMADLAQKIEKHRANLSALMITYPSTHGVFEETITEICQMIHAAGGQVYMDGANFNALVGIARPGAYGADVMHMNLHKTFCIPHGGGGPGVGPIGVVEHLAPFLPGHRELGDGAGAVSAAPWGSALVLPITWMYLRMMGSQSLKYATQIAILNANYIAHRLKEAYPILYTGRDGYVAHECILDLRPIKDETGVSVDDIAKRLMDFGFHAPTMSFPVAGTLMVEPTESESLKELDRFCDAMLAIRAEIAQIENKEMALDASPLVHAPHTMAAVMTDAWDRAYSRQTAAFPDGRTQDKYWPTVGRIDNVHGDRNLVCSCPPMTEYA